ncbi:PREDICTED: scm-like with four MBT domains protein 1 [Priapulus caudatus]|uniref:Scm-like with four MBT domains protein 1 n=1 Tax=Priapulus caudatus TaxID=37621 RepID=A0ABM1F704_PRICU|nr:PREDICTED: scm-like with four MBT domains protein 1 [Priapulus caudatus]
MKEVLSMFISVAYKSSRVLRELQLTGKPAPACTSPVKAKYKGKTYRATVEICKNTDQVGEFCRQVCIRLECCPYLFGPDFVNNNCPENCSQLTKTKYTYYYARRSKRPGRPQGAHEPHRTEGTGSARRGSIGA